jgi:carboxymethylenebutenolidase
MKDRERSAGTDLAAVFDAHVRHEFVDRDVDATMATKVAEPYVYHLPTMTGGQGGSGVSGFYRDHFIGKWPEDTKVERISRMVGPDQVVDEIVVSFTHDREIDVLLPGMAPTGRRVELPHVVVMKFEGGKIAHEHIDWDQASLRVQVGLLDPRQLPAVGAEQARWLRDRSPRLNLLLEE